MATACKIERAVCSNAVHCIDIDNLTHFKISFYCYFVRKFIGIFVYTSSGRYVGVI